MAVTHARDITVPITLASLPVTLLGFNQLILVDEDAGNDLGGARTLAFAEPEDVQTALDATQITTAVSTQVLAAFLQRPRPQRVYLGRVDTGAGSPETYAAGLTAVRADIGDDFFVITIDSRTAATQVAFATAVEATDFFFAFQSADADWLTTGIPSAYSAIAAYEQSGMIYHDTATQYHDTAWVSKWMAANPDAKRSPGAVPLKGVTGLATGLTETQLSFLQAVNGNVALPLGPESYFVSRATNMAGRPVHEILTAAWFARRLGSDLAAEIVAYAGRNEGIPVNSRGEAVLDSIISARAELGVQAGHFGEPFEVAVQPVTSADKDAGQIRATFRAENPNIALKFEVSGFMSRTSITAA